MRNFDKNKPLDGLASPGNVDTPATSPVRAMQPAPPLQGFAVFCSFIPRACALGFPAPPLRGLIFCSCYTNT